MKKIKNYPFSISTDASNKGNRKFFPIAVRFFDPQDGVFDYLLDFCEEPDESSAFITDTILNVLNKLNLNLLNMVAYGADNASVNYGRNCSVFQKLKHLQPSVIKANCNCHVVRNAAKHSMKKLSYDVETLVIKVFNQFSCSAKNVQSLKECFNFFQLEFKNVLQHISIRWGSLHYAVDHLIMNWKAIKIYFLEEGEIATKKINS